MLVGLMTLIFGSDIYLNCNHYTDHVEINCIENNMDWVNQQIKEQGNILQSSLNVTSISTCIYTSIYKF